MARTRSRGGFWVGAVAEICIIVASLVYVVSSELWALIAWEALATGYLAIGFTLAWSGKRPSRVSRGDVRAVARWSWVLPLISSFAGVNSAVLALFGGHLGDVMALATVAVGAVVVMSGPPSGRWRPARRSR